jgi:hypothetical protein
MKLTGTNRSFGLIALIYQCPPQAGIEDDGEQMTEDRKDKFWPRHLPSRKTSFREAGMERDSLSVLCHPSSVLWRRLCRRSVLRRPGGSCEGPKPDPIPNSAVKSLSAYGTKSQGLGESVAARPANHRRQRTDDRRQIGSLSTPSLLVTRGSSLSPRRIWGVRLESRDAETGKSVVRLPISVLRSRGVEQSGSSSGS